MDINLLKAVLIRNGIGKDALMTETGWQSDTTYYRHINGKSDWTVPEINALIALGVSLAEVIDVFFEV